MCPETYAGHDVSCDVAVPHQERQTHLVVTPEKQRAWLTTRGRYRASRHLHVHAHSGPRHDRADR